jgi:hypothetical protein
MAKVGSGANKRRQRAAALLALLILATSGFVTLSPVTRLEIYLVSSATIGIAWLGAWVLLGRLSGMTTLVLVGVTALILGFAYLIGRQL